MSPSDTGSGGLMNGLGCCWLFAIQRTDFSVVGRGGFEPP